MSESFDLEELTEVKNNQAIFLAYIVLKDMCSKRKKPKKEDLNFIFQNYSFLLAERKNVVEYEKKLKAINNFMGLR